MEVLNKNAEMYKICNKCEIEYNICAVQKCEHPKVIEVYGASICINCCKKCSYVIKHQYGHISCSLKGKNNEKSNVIQAKVGRIRKREGAISKQQFEL